MNELKRMFYVGRLNPVRLFSYLGFIYSVAITYLYIMHLFSDEKNLHGHIHAVIIYFLALIPLLSWWYIRRINDFNYSAFFILIPLAMVALNLYFNMLVLHLITYLSILTIAVWPSYKKDNKYGSVPPKNTFFNIFFCTMFFLIIILMLESSYNIDVIAPMDKFNWVFLLAIVVIKLIGSKLKKPKIR
jgi:uncharacterized membrane protein YhaH (DUF805 family)